MTSTQQTLTGWILSQNYPRTYRNRLDNTLTLTYPNPSNGRMILKVTSEMFSMEDCMRCDFLSINSDSGLATYTGNGGRLAAGRTVRCKFRTWISFGISKNNCALVMTKFQATSFLHME